MNFFNQFNMKNLVKILMMLGCICWLNACDDSEQGGDKPVRIENYNVTPIYGGATVTYTIPSARNILYVMAEYERNGKTYTERSSVYNNYITIQGFNTTEKVTATLYTVNINEMKSEPLTIEFVPLEALVNLARKSTSIKDDWGGLLISWENIYETDFAIHLLARDSLNRWEEKGLTFSSMKSDKHNFRGLEPVETSFALTFEDKWGNTSDTLFYTGIPLNEVEVSKPWRDLRGAIPYDNVTQLSSAYDFTKLFDGAFGNNYRYLTGNGSTGSSITFEFDRVVKLSRVAIWSNPEGGGRPVTDNVYGEVHVVEFEMWGTKSLDLSKLTPENRAYWLHPFSATQQGGVMPWVGRFSRLTPEQIEEIPANFAKDWVYLGHFFVERLDLLGASENDILAKGIEGFHFDISIDCEPVKIVRFFPLATRDNSPPPNNYWQIGELTFWGDDSVPQD